MNKQLRAAFHDWSRLRNEFCKNPSKENEKSYKQSNKWDKVFKKGPSEVF